MKALTQYVEYFNVHLKNVESPIEITKENGEALGKALSHKDCPAFVQILGSFYNRYQIARVILNKRRIGVDPDEMYYQEQMKRLREKRNKTKA